MTELLALVIVLILAWSWVCVTAGRIYEVRRRLRQMQQAEADELAARDAWFHEQGVA